MEAMTFNVKQGDGATVTLRMTSVRGKKTDPFEIRFAYVVSKVLGPGETGAPGYLVDVRVLDARKPGHAVPSGFQELVQSIIPPVQLRLNGDFKPVEVVNARQVAEDQKRALAKLKQADKQKQMLVLAVMLMVMKPEAMLDNLRPISELQGHKWVARNGAFEVPLKRSTIVPMEGLRKIVPVEARNDRIFVTTVTHFDTAPLLAKMAGLWEIVNKARREKGQPELELKMEAGSKGEATLDRQTGWLVKSREVLTVSMPGGGTGDRTEIVELEQVRH